MNFSIIAASRLRVLSSPFIIEVDTSKAGSANDQFQFTGAVGDYDVVAKQGGTIVQTFNNLSNNATITFANGVGIYTLEVKRKETNGFNRIAFSNSGDKLKITDIKQWGSVDWSNFVNSFVNCSNLLATATDAPNLSNLNNLSAMFQNCIIAEPNTENWDVSNVINISSMFFNAKNANPDTTNWNVSSVTNMRDMFRRADIANPDTTNWDVSSVTNMLRMFETATAANPNMRNWDVSNVTNMGNMLSGANLSTDNLDGCYTNWSQLTLRQNVSFHAGTTKFSAAAQAGRDILVNTYNWTITDGGLV
jgi:hypothetical protein